IPAVDLKQEFFFVGFGEDTALPEALGERAMYVKRSMQGSDLVRRAFARIQIDRNGLPRAMALFRGEFDLWEAMPGIFVRFEKHGAIEQRRPGLDSILRRPAG